MIISVLSPYHGGSHKAWADGLAQNSQHEITLFTLPDRFWKWRMHGSAVTLAHRFLAEAAAPDLILATDMVDLTTFLALTRQKTAVIPTVLYMHENQLTYPLPPDGRSGPMRRQHGERDLHYAFINYASMMAADSVLFNSHYHLESFFSALPSFLKHFPEYNELRTIPVLRAKSHVMPVGVDFSRLAGRPHTPPVDTPPLIVWNQRWEYDKNPEGLFAALLQIAEEGIPFRLALCGQQYGKRPSIFKQAIHRLHNQIVHIGYADLAQYRQLLWQAEITLSTAVHEFFGISILEAVYCHTFPILPNRLSYPELLPQTYHNDCLYENKGELLEKLRWALTHRLHVRQIAHALATAVLPYSWPAIAPQYDKFITKSVGLFLP
ncbi:MAG: DUF3524 domain-containing protein [Anaerolineales bacterium]|nr:DUF3524 domain-containing protein [Anaerolineales bacterium]